MQRVTNCIFVKDNQVLLLQKPRRGWWAIPGGKMEPTETIKEAAMREYVEETGVSIEEPELKGVYSFIIKNKNQDQIVSEWMMFTFVSTKGSGIEKTVTDEGILKWHSIDEIDDLPMAEGDRFIIKHAAQGKNIEIGLFEYTEDFELLVSHLEYA